MPRKKKDDEEQNIKINQNVSAEGGSSAQGIEQNLVVNIFKKYDLKWILLAVAVIILVIVGTGYWILSAAGVRQPEKMTAILRVAVAGFTVNGERDQQQLGEEIAEELTLNIENILTELDLEFFHEVWGPARVGSIKGDNREERALSASEIADKYNADIVIYGELDTTDSSWQVTPEFYVGGVSFSDASEITGQHEFGDKVTIPGLGDNASRIALSSELASRSDVLSRMIIGIAFYSTRNFERAYTEFSEIEDESHWPETMGGKQLLYLLLGNTKGRIEHVNGLSADYSEVEEWYKVALAEDGEYARAYVGLGNVYFEEALASIQPTDEDFSHLNLSLLDSSIEHYKQATLVQNQPAFSDIDAKVHFGLGQAYLMKSYTDPNITVARAVEEYEAVIADYNDGANPRVRELAAESYFRLGIIFEAGGDVKTAIVYTEKSIELIEQVGEFGRLEIFQEQLDELQK